MDNEDSSEDDTLVFYQLSENPLLHLRCMLLYFLQNLKRDLQVEEKFAFREGKTNSNKEYSVQAACSQHATYFDASNCCKDIRNPTVQICVERLKREEEISPGGMEGNKETFK